MIYVVCFAAVPTNIIDVSKYSSPAELRRCAIGTYHTCDRQDVRIGIINVSADIEELIVKLAGSTRSLSPFVKILDILKNDYPENYWQINPALVYGSSNDFADAAARIFSKIEFTL